MVYAVLVSVLNGVQSLVSLAIRAFLDGVLSFATDPIQLEVKVCCKTSEMCHPDAFSFSFFQKPRYGRSNISQT